MSKTSGPDAAAHEAHDPDPDPPSSYPPIPAYDFIGRCYDVLRVDPLDFSRGALSEAYAFSFSPHDFISSVSIGGNTYSLPRGLTFQSLFQGEQTGQVSVYTTSYDYQTYLRQQGGLSVSDPASSAFSASLSYSAERTQKDVFEHERSLALTTARYLTWSMSVSDLSKLSLNEALYELFKSELTSNESKLDSVFGTFGTHYAHRVAFGGRAFQEVVIDGTTYTNFLEQSVDIKAELGATFEAAKVGGNWQNNWKVSDTFKNGVKNTTESLKFQGGTPSVSGSFDMWYQSVPSAPAAIEIELRPLSALLSPRIFADARPEQLQQLRNRLDRALKDYIERNGRPAQDDTLRYGDRVQIQFIRGQQELWLSVRSDGKSIRLSGSGAGDDTVWIISARGSERPLQFGAAVRLRHEERSMFLDARAGSDGDYDVGDGLVGLSSGAGAHDVTDWFLSRPVQSNERSIVLNRDLIRIETKFRSEGSSSGFLTAPKEDRSGRIFSFGTASSAGAVWRLVRMAPK